MVVVYGGYDQYAGLCSQHGGGQSGVRGDDVTLETPGDRQRFVTPGDNTGQLGKISLVD